MQHEERNAEIYIVAGKTPVPLKDMATLIATKLGVKPPWLHLPVKPMQILGTVCETICTPLGINPPIFRRRVDFYTKSRNFNPAKVQDHLGFQPAQDFDGEIDDIIASYKEAGVI